MKDNTVDKKSILITALILHKIVLVNKTTKTYNDFYKNYTQLPSIFMNNN